MYGWDGAVEHGVDLADLDDPPEVHHRHPVGDVPHHRQVVGDEQVADSPSSVLSRSSRLSTPAWIDTSRADTGSSSTISRGFERERPGDADALALAAGELAREAGQVQLRVEPDDLEQLAHARVAPLVRDHAVGAQRLGEDVGDRQARVQRGHRVLEHHLHVAPDLHPLVAAQPARRCLPSTTICALLRRGQARGSP